MKVIHLKKRWVICIAILLCFCAYALFNLVGYIFNCKYLSVVTAIHQANDYEVRSRLLMEAMNEVGVCDPTDAAEVWASGLEKRSAALQYAVMDAQLKAEYARQLEKNAPNWVTGVSSPWVDSYRITKTESPDKNSRIIHLTFSTATSTGPAGDYEAVLTIACEGDFWRITKISADPGLYPYTRFNP